jgi:staphylococcal nuclease domain-containing protein 1
MRSEKEVPTHHVNDVSTPGPKTAARAKQYLPSFQRTERHAAVVEYVMSGHRLRLFMSKEGVTIAFSPSGALQEP